MNKKLKLLPLFVMLLAGLLTAALYLVLSLALDVTAVKRLTRKASITER